MVKTKPDYVQIKKLDEIWDFPKRNSGLLIENEGNICIVVYVMRMLLLGETMA